MRRYHRGGYGWRRGPEEYEEAAGYGWAGYEREPGYERGPGWRRRWMRPRGGEWREWGPEEAWAYGREYRGGPWGRPRWEHPRWEHPRWEHPRWRRPRWGEEWGRARPPHPVARGWPAPERWWHAVGPEPHRDYDWAFGAGRPEDYGWPGETGRG